MEEVPEGRWRIFSVLCQHQMSVRPKKHLGQHFLRDQNIAAKIARSLSLDGYNQLLEIGPGTGALTKHLMELPDQEVHCLELDEESVDYLKNTPEFNGLKVHHADFLKEDLSQYIQAPFALVGNFPYNISSQIVFKMLEHRNDIPEMVGMFQKEVAVRFAAGPGSKTYGIISVLAQAWYDIEVLFTVPPQVFDPPPKVNSAVIRFKRNAVDKLDCNEELFKRVVKNSFNQRRKTLRNSLKSLTPEGTDTADAIWGQRPEQLSVAEFVELTSMVSNYR